MSSPYYPPRARWYGCFLSPWFTLRRVLHLEQIHLPGGISPGQFVASLVVPAFSFFARGRRLADVFLVGVYCLAVLVFLVALGYPAASVCYGLMISAHAISIFYLELLWLRESRIGFKVAAALITLLAIWQVFYSSVLGFAGHHWFLPLRVRERVVVVRPVAPQVVSRGDWIAYSQREARSGEGYDAGVYARAGFGCGPVLAVAGDRVEFSNGVFAVNGRPQPSLPHMPQAGGLVVPEKHWFVWPDFDITQHGNVGEATISSILLRLAVVSEDQFVGSPFQSWFWRRQTLRPSS